MAQDEADYVIVGGGTAGCVLANRLSADPACRVVVIEAGDDATSPWISVPAGIAKLFQHPKLNWRYQTEPEKRSAAAVSTGRAARCSAARRASTA